MTRRPSTTVGARLTSRAARRSGRSEQTRARRLADVALVRPDDLSGLEVHAVEHELVVDVLDLLAAGLERSTALLLDRSERSVDHDVGAELLPELLGHLGIHATRLLLEAHLVADLVLSVRVGHEAEAPALQ